jgi:arginine/lysine/ornithine decarboxylase
LKERFETPQSLPPLGQALRDYDRHERRRFHVPAHAGRFPGVSGFSEEPYRYDLTELDGLDVLSEPSGCLREAQEQIAGLFGAAHSFFLVNGATVGLLAALLAALRPGDKVLLPRNAHRSVLSGLILTGAEPIWLLPERLPGWGLWGGVSVDEVRLQLNQHPDVKALALTSPTYEGIGSDTAALAALCRERGVLLVVDEAHGSLWPLTRHLPASAVQTGADAVIHSIHKSGGCLTQGALAHLPEGSRLNPAAFQQALNLVQTTSPSYLLMASLEATCHFLASDAGRERVDRLFERIVALRRELPPILSALRLFEPEVEKRAFWDPAKLYWIHPHCSGEVWGARFESELKIAYESASPYGVLYLANVGLEDEDFTAFRTAFQNGERLLTSDSPGRPEKESSLQAALERANPATLLPEMTMTPREAFFSPGIHVPATQAIGRTARETIVHCPPGIPVLLPGERVQALHIPFLPEDGLWVVR